MSIKEPEGRRIHSLVHVEGLSGKSIFFKWLTAQIGEKNR